MSLQSAAWRAMCEKVLVFAIVTLAMTVVVAAAYIVGALRGLTDEVRQGGVMVNGTVVARPHALDVEYDFDERHYRHRVGCGPDNCVKYGIGDLVALKVDPEDPSRVVLAESPYTVRGARTAGVVAAGSVVGVGLCLLLLGRIRDRRRNTAASGRDRFAGRRRALIIASVMLGLASLLLTSVATMPGGIHLAPVAIVLGAGSSAGFAMVVIVAMRQRLLRKRRGSEG